MEITIFNNAIKRARGYTRKALVRAEQAYLEGDIYNAIKDTEQAHQYSRGSVGAEIAFVLDQLYGRPSLAELAQDS